MIKIDFNKSKTIFILISSKSVTENPRKTSSPVIRLFGEIYLPVANSIYKMFSTLILLNIFFSEWNRKNPCENLFSSLH